MLSYINNDTKCRNRQLLHYFGENKKKNCGTCDVCLARTKTYGPATQEVIEGIVHLLGSKERSSRTLIELLPYDAPRVLEALQALLEDHTIVINFRNEYTLS
jgi:ATP-dependent DNA helicase RecQ